MFQPDFSQLLAVLSREKPDRPVLFEFFLYDALYRKLAGPAISVMKDELAPMRLLVQAFRNGGYDYASMYASSFRFTAGPVHMDKTKSLNEGGVIANRAQWDAYRFDDPDDFSDFIGAAAPLLPDGMQFMVWGPGGVLENVIGLTGYDNLCYMLYEDPELVADLFNAVGARLYRYYERVIGHPSVGVLMSNDDWGFNTQTFLSPKDMRKYVFPWHEAFVNLAHDHGKPAILHSCGYAGEVMEDIIAMGYDAKHSYEDNIQPVEQAYEQYGKRIAILGGIDLDFVISRPKQEVYDRSLAMAKKGFAGGGYALGTGNSVPYYVPDEQYFAMVSASHDLRREVDKG